MYRTVMPSLAARHGLGSRGMPITVPQKNAVDDFHYIGRRILLQKGRLAQPRLVSQACAGMTTVDQIVLVMQELTRRGLGEYNPFYVDGDKSRRVFIKRPLAEIQHVLDQFGLSGSVYEERYNEMSPVARGKRSSTSLAPNKLLSK
ncbi:hypothetical protein LSH36_375g02070 [Paralvinella palmiformis]|uniref:Uncharacterized protein n=1 Tax=Paralvinella palmiformis TaxID=53620 RepID=A0AAD9N121_9ANNE|nr:hypothetical protein LSH36_375g02070 [Paralvinella palmiformis]